MFINFRFPIIFVSILFAHSFNHKFGAIKKNLAKSELYDEFDPFQLSNPATTGNLVRSKQSFKNSEAKISGIHNYNDANNLSSNIFTLKTVPTALLIPTCATLFPTEVMADSKLVDQQMMNKLFDPSNFQPVCPASDNVYQVLKLSTNALVGTENAYEYGPLIASLLLRVRLEICVLESFFYEAVIPFIQAKGVSWILPLHETIETFLAGTIFALACNVVLIGSTKIISILVIIFDILTGLPARLIGDLIAKFSQKDSKGNNVGIIMKAYGETLGFCRKAVENVDTFVGRYLVLATTVYIAFKFFHFKVFNFFP